MYVCRLSRVSADTRCFKNVFLYLEDKGIQRDKAGFEFKLGAITTA